MATGRSAQPKRLPRCYSFRCYNLHATIPQLQSGWPPQNSPRSPSSRTAYPDNTQPDVSTFNSSVIGSECNGAAAQQGAMERSGTLSVAEVSKDPLNQRPLIWTLASVTKDSPIAYELSHVDTTHYLLTVA